MVYIDKINRMRNLHDSKAENVMQAGDLQGKPSRVASKRMKRNPDGLSHTPEEWHKKLLSDPDIGPVLQ